MAISIAYVTYPSIDEAERISGIMVERRLAACANVFPIKSIFLWEGKKESESEHAGLLKTSPDLWDRLSKAIEEEHPYDTPCIIRLDASANKAYEAWVASSVG